MIVPLARRLPEYNLPVRAARLAVVDGPVAPNGPDWESTFESERENSEPLFALSCKSDRRLRERMALAALTRLERRDSGCSQHLNVRRDTGI